MRTLHPRQTSRHSPPTTTGHRQGSNRGNTPNPMPHSKWGRLIILLGLISFSPAVAQEVRFDHVGHQEAAKAKQQPWLCSQCHAGGVGADGVRPASKNHQSCNADGCHAKDFYGPELKARPMCTLCHQNDQPWEDMRTLKTFPSTDKTHRTYCIKFSHRLHLAKDKLGRKACDGCHKMAADKVTYMPPSHGDCATCHTEDHSVPMSACETCHEMGSADGALLQCSPPVPWRSRQVAARFSHDTHRLDIRKPGNPPLSCVQCHRGVHRSESIRKIRLMYGFGTMTNSCGRCHNGRTRVPDSKRRIFSTSTQCSKCHGGKFAGMGTPKGH